MTQFSEHHSENQPTTSGFSLIVTSWFLMAAQEAQKENTPDIYTGNKCLFQKWHNAGFEEVKCYTCLLHCCAEEQIVTWASSLLSSSITAEFTQLITNLYSVSKAAGCAETFSHTAQQHLQNMFAWSFTTRRVEQFTCRQRQQPVSLFLWKHHKSWDKGFLWVKTADISLGSSSSSLSDSECLLRLVSSSGIKCFPQRSSAGRKHRNVSAGLESLSLFSCLRDWKTEHFVPEQDENTLAFVSSAHLDPESCSLSAQLTY